jgi:hypothetical protein
VGSEVLVALLVTVVLGDVVEVLAADDDGAVHLGRDDTASQDTAADRDETGERALLVCDAEFWSTQTVPLLHPRDLQHDDLLPPLIPIARDVTYRRRAVDSLFVVAHRSEIGLVGSCW